MIINTRPATTAMVCPEESPSRIHQLSARNMIVSHGSLRRERWKLTPWERPTRAHRKPHQCDESHSGAAIAVLKLPALSDELTLSMRKPTAGQAPGEFISGLSA